MDIVIQPGAEAAAEFTARVIAEELRARPAAVLGLATGRTMEAVYARLAAMHRDQDLDFSAARTFNLDEYIGLAATDPRSYRQYMNRHLFNRVNIDLRNTHLPDGVAPDLDAECEQYEHLIRQAGGIDLQLLGIGDNGHLGFNEPLSSFQSRTRVSTLAAETIDQNARFFGSARHMPRRAITMGIGTILEARRCVLLATGRDKAAILAQAVEGPVTSAIPATALQMHSDCSVITDEAAASRFQRSGQYRAAFDQNPRWQQIRRAAMAVGKP